CSSHDSPGLDFTKVDDETMMSLTTLFSEVSGGSGATFCSGFKWNFCIATVPRPARSSSRGARAPLFPKNGASVSALLTVYITPLLVTEPMKIPRDRKSTPSRSLRGSSLRVAGNGKTEQRAESIIKQRR